MSSAIYSPFCPLLPQVHRAQIGYIHHCETPLEWLPLLRDTSESDQLTSLLSLDSRGSWCQRPHFDTLIPKLNKVENLQGRRCVENDATILCQITPHVEN